MKPTIGLTLFSALLLLAACQQDDFESSASEIIGGSVGTVGEFPTTVALGVGGGLCTGTFIAPDLILTAAHCITPSLLGLGSQQEVTSQLRVTFDTLSIFSGGGITVAASETIPHPNFSTNGLGDNDVGLIRLASPMTDRAFTPINRITEDAPIGISLTQVGYGASQVGGGGAGTLRVLRGKVTSSCASFGASDANLLCFSQTDGTGKCQGDSGGPSYAMIGDVQRVVGITSFGDQTCAQFGADTRVDAELEFLFEHAPELQCQADGACNEDCGKGSLPWDDDCELCTKDTDCEGESICNPAGECIPAPFSPGGEGSVCSDGTDCDSALCAVSEDSGICTSSCQSDDTCLDGFECVEAGAQNVCWPKGEESGGCSVGSTGKQLPGAMLFLLAFFIGFRRRRLS